MTNTYTLRPGDFVEYAGQRCRVVRVSESAAVVAVIQKPRTITPRFGKPVTIQPRPKLERISPNSDHSSRSECLLWGIHLVAGLGSQLPILNR